MPEWFRIVCSRVKGAFKIKSACCNGGDVIMTSRNDSVKSDKDQSDDCPDYMATTKANTKYNAISL
jgi:hypothetical protein